jgi:hypothetical protein
LKEVRKKEEGRRKKEEENKKRQINNLTYFVLPFLFPTNSEIIS